MVKYAVIVAGGTGERMGTNVPKQFLPLEGKPILLYTIDAFIEAFPDLTIVLVVPEKHLTSGQDLVRKISESVSIIVVTGGANRFESVKNGLKSVQNNSIIFVHDAVRCMVSPALIKKCYDGAMKHGNAVPVVPVTDSVRILNEDGNEAADRSTLRLIQTPQTFLSEQLLPAFAQAYQPSFTDEATVVENLGIKINLVDGDQENIKITRPIDIIIATEILRSRSKGNRQP